LIATRCAQKLLFSQRKHSINHSTSAGHGPGAIATVLGMTSLVKHSEIEFVSFVAVSAAVVGDDVHHVPVPGVRKESSEPGWPNGIDAATRMIGFFVSAMGMGLIFDGVTEAFQANRIMMGG
jgi:multiple antibiotic resistance protein